VVSEPKNQTWIPIIGSACEARSVVNKSASDRLGIDRPTRECISSCFRATHQVSEQDLEQVAWKRYLVKLAGWRMSVSTFGQGVVRC
jgi:hypothetical protein